MAFKDMRAFLAMLEQEGQLKHVDVPFDGRRGSNELQSLMNYICSKEGPALMLNNVDAINTKGVPILFNPFGTRERTAMTIGFRDWRAAKLHHAAVLGNPERWIPPKLVDRSKASCKEVIIKGADDMIGVVTVHDGRSLAQGQIIAPICGDDPSDLRTYHNNFQDPEAFLAAGGSRGRQLQVLCEGTYNINRLFATIEMIPKTVVEVGKAGMSQTSDGEHNGIGPGFAVDRDLLILR